MKQNIVKISLAVIIAAVIIAAAISLSGCAADDESTSESGTQSAQTEAATLALTENGGLLECVDTEHSPIKDCGIHTIVDKTAGTVTFYKTDKNGSNTVEYIKFKPSDSSVEKYYYVSAMGTGFYYYYDLDAGEMVRLENANHEDSTASAKENGRWDNSAETMNTEVEALEAYFAQYFGSTIAESVS